ncbi:MAG: hypothetical protein LBO05_08645, partial [Deltaproteobacteria bacterium]|nr:hypothetical protein [Deltaproteobacteria bacterium]
IFELFLLQLFDLPFECLASISLEMAPQFPPSGTFGLLVLPFGRPRPQDGMASSPLKEGPELPFSGTFSLLVLPFGRPRPRGDPDT